ncbi:MAG: tetratricopeptide repeat protein [Bacteroidota bacterium]
MDPTSTLAEIRDLITRAKNEEAAEQLLQYISTAGEPASSWENSVRNLLAQYKRIKLDQQKNTISYDAGRLGINQVTNGLLGILNNIEAGKAAPKPAKAVNTNNRRNLWMSIGVVVALLLGGTSFLMLRNNNTPSPEDEASGVEEGVVKDKCPEYAQSSEFNIMLLPYLPLDGNPKGVETALRINLAGLLESYNIMGSVFTQMIEHTSPEYPLTGQAAVNLAKPCKAQLIIWGTTEEDKTTNSIITTTKFRFVDSENFSLADLSLNNEAEVDTVTSLSSIATGGDLTEEIDATLRLILGLVAHETNHHEDAAKILDDVIEERGGVAQNPKWGVIQADSYIRSGQEERALKVYRDMKGDSTNVQALLQKGLLELKTGNTQMAAKDLNAVLEKDPQNTEALAARSVIRVQQNRLFEANKDLEKLEELEANTPVASSIRQKYQQQHVMESKKLTEAEQKITANPDDTSAWRIKAETAANLGEFSAAKDAATKLLRVDPHNMAALYTLVQIQPWYKDSLQIQKQLQRRIPALSPEQKEDLRIRVSKGGG